MRLVDNQNRNLPLTCLIQLRVQRGTSVGLVYAESLACLSDANVEYGSS
jgi:hypothetical protein